MNFNLGHLCGALEMGVDPVRLPTLEGFSQGLRADSTGVLGRKVASAAGAIMVESGLGKSAAAQHLRLVAESPDWTHHHQEVVDDVIRAACACEVMTKHAFADALGAAGLGARGLTYGSLGLGAGLGALYWLLSRHSNQDEADTEAMSHQAHYYDQLAHELEHSMNRKYRYNEIEDVPAR